MINPMSSKKFKLIFSWLIISLLCFSFFLPHLAQGQEGTNPQLVSVSPLDELKKIQEVVTKELMPDYKDPILSIVQIINYLLNLIGVVFLIMIIYGGIMWMTARGNEEQAKKAKTILTSAAWGLVVVVLARVLYIFVRERISGAGGGMKLE